MAALALSAPSSTELLHVPCDVTVRGRLSELIRSALITEFPVNSGADTPCQVSPDEAVELLLSPSSPWAREAWWSPDVLPLLEASIRCGRRVTSRRLLSRLLSLSLPQLSISSVGDQPSRLSRLASCSLACNNLTSVRGTDLPRSLRSLQLYGNRLSDLTELVADCPPLEFLGLGAVQMTDEQLRELTVLLGGTLPSLRAIDLCDNHIGDLAAVTDLITTAPNIRSVTLSGNPAFLVTGYYQHFLTERGRLTVLDGQELTEEALEALASQLRQSEHQSETSAKSRKKSTKKKSPKKSVRRPAADLDPARFEPSPCSALIRISGVIFLPLVPKQQWPGLELCAVFQWAGDRPCYPPLGSPAPDQGGGETGSRATDGLCPLEAPILDRGDVTVLETPLEWVSGDLRALRDAMLAGLRVDVLRREKWTPKRPKKGKKKDSGGKEEKGSKNHTKNKEKKEKEKDVGKNGERREGSVEKGEKGKMKQPKGKDEKRNKQTENKGKGKHKTETPGKEMAAPEPDGEDLPPPEFVLGTVLLPLRGLLRPDQTLLLSGAASAAGTVAARTDTHWTEAIQTFQEEKKQKKAAAKRTNKEEDDKKQQKKKMSASSRSASAKKKSAEPKPEVQCYFAIELYRKPALETAGRNDLYLPIDEI